MQAQTKTPKSLRKFRVFRFLLLLLIWGFFCGIGLGYHEYAYFAKQLPKDLKALRDQPTMATLVYSADGELIGEYFLQKRVILPLERIPERVRQAFIAAEDGRFWEHPGFDIFGISRAAITNFRSGEPSQGASTITQQVTRDILLSKEKTIDRKIKELILSVRVERELTKRDILEMYLNRVYLGHGAYGVQAAAASYFGKNVEDLSLAEAAMLAGLPQRPADYSPLRNLAAAKNRQKYTLERMQADGYITAGQALAALEEPIALVTDTVSINHVAAPYFVEHVRRWAQKRFGEGSVFYGGLRIYTTLDMHMQRSAEVAVRNGLETVDRSIGFRGPIGHLDEAEQKKFVKSAPRPYSASTSRTDLSSGTRTLTPDITYVAMIANLSGKSITLAIGDKTVPMVDADSTHLRQWPRARGDSELRSSGLGPKAPPKEAVPLAVGDLIPAKIRFKEVKEGKESKNKEPKEPNIVAYLSQTPEIQGAMVALDQNNGKIKAMVGGYDFRQSQFNRVTQAKRQIGSTIKPFIYATAISRGVNQLDIFRDAKVSVQTASGIWRPSNYDGEYLGPVTLRTAIAKSLNTIAVQLTLRVGVDAVINFMHNIGIRSKITRHVSIALGTPDLTLLEAVSGYGVFANGGKRIPGQDGTADEVPGRFVELVTTQDGTVVADYRRRLPTDQVIEPSLAYVMTDLLKTPVERGTAKKAQELKRAAAGKTGTSTGWRDAWFIGYTSNLLAGVWLGRDDFTPFGVKATGGTAALPIWLEFMKASHPDVPAQDFEIPRDVVMVAGNDLTGQPAPPGASSSRWIAFMRGSVPPRFAPGFRETRFSASASFGNRIDVVPDVALEPTTGPEPLPAEDSPATIAIPKSEQLILSPETANPPATAESSESTPP